MKPERSFAAAPVSFVPAVKWSSVGAAPLEPGPASAIPTNRPILSMKYIRHKKLGFILFEGALRHDEIAASLGGHDEIVSAGFIFAPVLTMKCLGYSDSLQLSAAAADSDELRSRMSG